MAKWSMNKVERNTEKRNAEYRSTEDLRFWPNTCSKFENVIFVNLCNFSF